MSNPRINQCMSCSYFRNKLYPHCLLAHDINKDEFCYEYGDLEDEGSASEDTNVQGK